MTISSSSLCQKARWFFRYGYAPEPRWDILDLFADGAFADLRTELGALSQAELVSRMHRTARAVFEQSLAGLYGDIVIPMSGGRDSRFILCMALELGLKDRVVAITWGVPGGLDWDIAAKVTHALGVRHERIDTTRQRIGFRDLRRAFENGAHWTDLLCAHYNQVWRAITPPSAIAIVGYLGGPTIGCHYALGHEQMSLREAIGAFERLNRRNAIGRPAPSLASAPLLLSSDRISLPEQLDLVFRQEGYLRRIVAPACLALRTPFAHPEWLRFAYAVPNPLRVNGALFSLYLTEHFSRAFAIGTSGACGLRADAPEWRRRWRRRHLRVRDAIANAARSRGFASFDKYGDARDLLATLQAPEPGAPAAYVRALRARAESSGAASEVRLRAMLRANLACELERERASAEACVA